MVISNNLLFHFAKYTNLMTVQVAQISQVSGADRGLADAGRVFDGGCAQREGGIVKLNTEVYGGPIMSTWFDRPLTLAGRVIVKGENAMNPQTLLLHVKRPLLQISNLAIHFNRQVNDGVKLSKQKDVLPILGIINDEL